MHRSVFFLHSKLSGHNLVPHLARTPIFEWCVLSQGSENIPSKDTRLKINLNYMLRTHQSIVNIMFY